MDRAQCLKGIFDAARSISAFMEHRRPTVVSSHPTAPFKVPTLRFPSREELLGPINHSAANAAVVEKLTVKLDRALQALQAAHTKAYESSCQQILSIPQSSHLESSSRLLETISKTYQNAYATSSLPIIECHRTALEKVGALGEKVRSTAKRSFNSEYTPLLEKYFEYNAFPSARDRDVLARKSMMTSRQIEVWFQNHRRRARKEERPLRRLTSQPLPNKLSLESLDELMPQFLQRPNGPQETPVHSDTDDSPTENTEQDPEQESRWNPLRDLWMPSHGFPAPYSNQEPMSSPEDSQVFSLDPSLWPRQRSTPTQHSTPISIVELTEMFSMKLRLSGPTSKRPPFNPVSMARTRWFCSRVTFPPPAPHPALLPSSRASYVSRPESSSVASTHRTSLVLRTPSRRRKPTPLTRRIPAMPPFSKFHHSRRSSPYLSSSGNSSRSSSTSSVSSIEDNLDLPTPPSSPASTHHNFSRCELNHEQAFQPSYLLDLVCAC